METSKESNSKQNTTLPMNKVAVKATTFVFVKPRDFQYPIEIPIYSPQINVHIAELFPKTAGTDCQPTGDDPDLKIAEVNQEEESGKK